jgi:hypothetical protein
VNHRSAGEVNCVQTARTQKPASPHPVGEGAVHQERPQADEDQVTPEAHSPDEGAGDEGRRDDREHHQKGHKQKGRDVGSESGRCHTDSTQHGVLESANDSRVIRAKGDRIPDNNPKD